MTQAAQRLLVTTTHKPHLFSELWWACMADNESSWRHSQQR